MYQRAWKLLLERLAQKTSWGRNELKELMLQCLIDAEEDPPQYVMCGTCGCIGLVGNCAYCEARTFPPPGELEVQSQGESLRTPGNGPPTPHHLSRLHADGERQ